jgi:hypothetical protein
MDMMSVWKFLVWVYSCFEYYLDTSVYPFVDGYYTETNCRENTMTPPYWGYVAVLVGLPFVVRGCLRMNVPSLAVFARRCLVTNFILWIMCYIEVYILIDWYYRYRLKRKVPHAVVFFSMSGALSWICFEWIRDIPAWFSTKPFVSQLGWFWTDPVVKEMEPKVCKKYEAKCCDRIRSCYIVMMCVSMMQVVVLFTLDYVACNKGVLRACTDLWVTTFYGFVAMIYMSEFSKLRVAFLRQKTGDTPPRHRQ